MFPRQHFTLLITVSGYISSVVSARIAAFMKKLVSTRGCGSAGRGKRTGGTSDRQGIGLARKQAWHVCRFAMIQPKVRGAHPRSMSFISFIRPPHCCHRQWQPSELRYMRSPAILILLVCPSLILRSQQPHVGSFLEV